MTLANNVGVQAVTTLSSFPSSREYHDFMVATGISYSSSAIREGWIYGNYAHKEIALGSLGLDATGTPNISLGGSIDSVVGYRHVSR